MSTKSTYAKGIVLLGVIAASIMYVLFFEHFTDVQWFWFLFGEGTAATIGLVGIRALDYYARIRGLADLDTKWQPRKVLVHFFIIFMVVIAIQKLITQILSVTMGALLSLEGPELIMYYCLGAVAEELFFRGFICRLIAGNKNNITRMIFAIAISTIAFMSIHVSYYGHVLQMSIVAGSGIALAVMYLYWKDLLANTLAHLFVNLIVVLLIVLA